MFKFHKIFASLNFLQFAHSQLRSISKLELKINRIDLFVYQTAILGKS